MKTTCFILSLLLVSSHGFARRAHFAASFHTQNIQNNSNRTPRPSLLNIRGGADPLNVAMLDYSDAAKALFGNMIGPASMIAGGLVPLGFLAQPLPDDKPWKKKAKVLYMILAVASLVNNLLAIVYGTVTINKLTEIPSAPAASVFALIRRDYELPWIATNVHFLFGLMGFCAMVMLRALTIYPIALNTAAAGLAFSGLLGMFSIVNVGVAAGDGTHKLGGNIFSLGVRYLILLAKHLYHNKTPLGALSLILFAYFGVRSIQNLMNTE